MEGFPRYSPNTARRQCLHPAFERDVAAGSTPQKIAKTCSVHAQIPFLACGGGLGRELPTGMGGSPACTWFDGHKAADRCLSRPDAKTALPSTGVATLGLLNSQPGTADTSVPPQGRCQATWQSSDARQYSNAASQSSTARRNLEMARDGLAGFAPPGLSDPFKGTSLVSLIPGLSPGAPRSGPRGPETPQRWTWTAAPTEPRWGREPFLPEIVWDSPEHGAVINVELSRETEHC